jgi:hypothetical protein
MRWLTALAVIGCATALGGRQSRASEASGWGTPLTPEQKRAAEQLGPALHVTQNMHENPPVCLRLQPSGRIIAVILGGQNLRRITAVLHKLRIKVTITVTSISKYNAALRRLARVIGASKPSGYQHVTVGYLQIPTLKVSSNLDFEPECAHVTLVRPTLHPESPSTAAEDGWTEMIEGKYGADLVMTWCCSDEKGMAKAL